MPETIFCPYCGAQNDDDDLFCVICGKKLSVPTAKTHTDPNPETQEQSMDSQSLTPYEIGRIIVASIVWIVTLLLCPPVVNVIVGILFMAYAAVLRYKNPNSSERFYVLFLSVILIAKVIIEPYLI